MDTALVDRLARALTATPTRRAVVKGLGGLPLAGRVLPGAAAKKDRCGPCRRTTRGTCRGKRLDGVSCGASRECCRGSCQAACAPNEQRNPVTCGCCLLAGAPCLPGPEACCSGLCVADIGDPVGVCTLPSGADGP